ncbi:hypothetical protein C943_01252 [Mariniradius saccharolyticus AK6]|uniref:Uncharacterized protein n=1 Tax=Mariniradius saccharolyticus AK6 TaxID=1239962 RepID=M7X4Z8_9BACT|nr:hypothetical protein C943_01252 [Mariniradius saccharolyticus AK6]
MVKRLSEPISKPLFFGKSYGPSSFDVQSAFLRLLQGR